MEDRRRPPPHQQRLRAWEHHRAPAAAPTHPRGISFLRDFMIMSILIFLLDRSGQFISCWSSKMNSETDLFRHGNATSRHAELTCM
jgi:hypothetical protein